MNRLHPPSAVRRLPTLRKKEVEVVVDKIMRLASINSEQPEKWLSLETSYPLYHLINMLIVIGNRGVVLKFGTSWSHLILLRDQRRTKNA
jgi:hypothetical protein